MARRTSVEVPFLDKEDAESFPLPLRPTQRERWASILPYSAILNVVLLFALVAVWNLEKHDPKKHYIPNEIYSPLQSAVEYHNVMFTGGLKGDTSRYLGSTKEVDEAWEALYDDVLISQISPAQAALLPNATTRFNNETDYHIVELDVFHQLHCLNMMRMMVYPDVYPMDLTSDTPEAKDNLFHMEHCYEQLRQSLQCTSDLATITWQWSRKQNRFLGNVHSMHTCKKWDKIHDWAVKHKAEQDLDFFKPVNGAPIFMNE